MQRYYQNFIEELDERERNDSVRKSEIIRNYFSIVALSHKYCIGEFDCEDCTQKAIDKNLKMIDEWLNVKQFQRKVVAYGRSWIS
jgi:hypothetical protein